MKFSLPICDLAHDPDFVRWCLTSPRRVPVVCALLICAGVAFLLRVFSIVLDLGDNEGIVLFSLVILAVVFAPYYVLTRDRVNAIIAREQTRAQQQRVRDEFTHLEDAEGAIHVIWLNDVALPMSKEQMSAWFAQLPPECINRYNELATIKRACASDNPI